MKDEKSRILALYDKSINTSYKHVKISELRQRIADINNVSDARVALFALVEMTFSDEVRKEVIDKALRIAENEKVVFIN